jgi:hypothetical protein
MKPLSKNWLTEYTTDLEYKKYMLLAFLKEVKENYDQTMLYPAFSEVISHYTNVESLLQCKQLFQDSIPTRRRGLDYTNMQLLYENMISNDKVMEQINELLLYASPCLKKSIDEGREIFNLVEQMVKIEAVGLLPLNKDAGYLIFLSGSQKEKKVYDYQVSMIEDPSEKYRLMSVNYCKSFYNTITDTFNAIKTELIRYNTTLPNPAVYAVMCAHELPFHETLLPVTKRIFLRNI